MCDTHRTKEEVQREIAKSVATCTPGPHAVLMMLRCDRRFTDEEFEVNMATFCLSLCGMGVDMWHGGGCVAWGWMCGMGMERCHGGGRVALRVDVRE